MRLGRDRARMGGRCGRAGRTVQVLDVRGGHDPLLIAVRDERLAGDVHLGGDVHGGADGGGPVVVVARARLAARVRVLREEVHPGAWTRYSPLCSEPSESLAQGDRARAREMRCGGRVFSRSAPGLGAARTPLVAFHLGPAARFEIIFAIVSATARAEVFQSGYPLATGSGVERRVRPSHLGTHRTDEAAALAVRFGRYQSDRSARVSRLGGSQSGVESGTDKTLEP